MKSFNLGHRTLYIILTTLLIPLLPIAVIFFGISSPEYVFYSVLNVDVSQKKDFWDVYTKTVINLMHLDFGISISSQRPVFSEIMKGLAESLKIIIPSIFISYVSGTLIGLSCVLSERANTLFQKLQFLFYIPMIVMAYLTIYALDYLGINFLSDIKYIFSSIILAIYPIYLITRSFHSTVIEVTHSDYYQFHLTCGFSLKQIWYKFCVKKILLNYASFLHVIVMFALGFIFYVETPFNIQGIGFKCVFAIQRFDYPLIIGFCILANIIINLVGLLVDMLKYYFDPRTANK